MSQRYEAYVVLSRGHPPTCSNSDCASSDLDVLVINHRRRDGGADRKQGMHGEALYRWIMRNPAQARTRLEVLCASCNLKLERQHYRGEPVYQRAPQPARTWWARYMRLVGGYWWKVVSTHPYRIEPYFSLETGQADLVQRGRWARAKRLYDYIDAVRSRRLHDAWWLGLTNREAAELYEMLERKHRTAHIAMRCNICNEIRVVESHDCWALERAQQEDMARMSEVP